MTAFKVVGASATISMKFAAPLLILQYSILFRKAANGDHLSPMICDRCHEVVQGRNGAWLRHPREATEALEPSLLATGHLFILQGATLHNGLEIKIRE